jgi:hypothetical protein
MNFKSDVITKIIKIPKRFLENKIEAIILSEDGE